MYILIQGHDYAQGRINVISQMWSIYLVVMNVMRYGGQSVRSKSGRATSDVRSFSSGTYATTEACLFPLYHYPTNAPAEHCQYRILSYIP